ncbi:hypothetical protein AGMMS4957_03200 [Bacteroidia bacterium]|nr:hypothetical protein AGMMS4957_03200 [Bacteroidia bacterium]
MIINRDYIVQRIHALIAEKAGGKQKTSNGLNLWRIKKSIPLWLRNIIFSRCNPFYVVYRGLQQCPKNISSNHSFSMFAAIFLEYFLDNDVNFDTRDFYPAEDEPLIREHIDNRIKSILQKALSQPMNEAQLQSEQISIALQKGMSERRNRYKLSYDGKQYCLPWQAFEVSVFGYHCGLKAVPDAAKARMAGTDFLDAGACIGDSALIFAEYNPHTVLAYEPVTENYRGLLKTIAWNSAEGKIEAIHKGLGDKDDVMEISIAGGSSSLQTVSNSGAATTEKISITTIDKECVNRTIGLIKMDVEGFEYFAVKGGLATITRDKPVLLISIYHTGKDFFEIPPMLKQAVPEYQFRYVDVSPLSPIYEKMLVAYV